LKTVCLNGRKGSNPLPSGIRNKCEHHPDVYRRGSVRICFYVI